MSRSLIRSLSTSTIYALSTPPGTSALAVVRLSGPSSFACVSSLLAPASTLPPPRQAGLRTLQHPTTGLPLDSALVLAFPSPHSSTGEDVVELHLHGGRAVVAAVLRALESARPAPTPASPGDFTRRAFLSGRLSLSQVEGLGDLLCADTEAQRLQAMALFGGALAARAAQWRSGILHHLATLEAILDFSPDEPDVQAAPLWAQCTAGAAALLAALRAELAAGARGELVRGGVRAALCGAPNAGKSSLLNALLHRPAAIVSPRAGTTRDVLRASLDLGGVPCTLADTAGLRDSGGQQGEGEEGGGLDEVEVEGMARARAEVQGAGVRLLVVDSAALAAAVKGSSSSSGGGGCVSLQQLLGVATGQAVQLLVLNKCDLALVSQAEALAALASVAPPAPSSSGSPPPPPPQVLAVSCKTGQGVSELLLALQAQVARVAWGEEGVPAAQPPLLTHARHRHAVAGCVGCLEAFLESSRGGGLPELGAEELRAAARALEPLIGAVSSEQLLDDIFARFCIGK